MQENRVLEFKIKSEYAVEMLNITKTFGSLYANNDVTLRVKKVKFMQFWVKMALVNQH